MVRHPRIFQRTATTILIIFMGIMGFAVFQAYLRPSGFAGITMAQIQKLRLEKNHQD